MQSSSRDARWLVFGLLLLLLMLILASGRSFVLWSGLLSRRPPTPDIRLHDILTVAVDERPVATEKAAQDTRRPTPDRRKFRMAVEVTDIQPDGCLVIEGHRSVMNDKERWDYSLSGVVRREDVSMANVVHTKNIAELVIHGRVTSMESPSSGETAKLPEADPTRR